MIAKVPKEKESKIAGYLGIAQRAGKIAAGDNAVIKSLSSGNATLLVIAEDAAPSVKEQLLSLTSPRIPCIMWKDKTSLGMVVGKSRRGAIAVQDQGFTKAIMKVMES